MFLLTWSANKERPCWTTITAIFFLKKPAVSVSNKEKLKKNNQANRTANGQNLTGTQYLFFFYRKRGSVVLLRKGENKSNNNKLIFCVKGKKTAYSILKSRLVNKNTIKSNKRTVFLLYSFKKSKLEPAFFLK